MNTYDLQFMLWRKQQLADGQTAWVHESDGKQCLTRIGIEVDLERILGLVPQGLCLEFGVATGKSIRRLAQCGRKIYGFDWWKGLPHDWSEADTKGVLICAKPQVPSNVELIEGLFSDTLEPFLLAHPGPVTFVHVDCDLWAPTLYVLNCLRERFVQGSIIAFDEIDVLCFGELQAWTRYLKETGQDWRLLGKQHQWGEVYRLA